MAGESRSRRRPEADEVSGESARAERKGGNAFSIAVEEQSFEGLSPRAWEAEKGFQGLKVFTFTERVAKPCG
jgi:hypothetical protein